MEFKFNELFPLQEERTDYYLLTKEFVSTAPFEGTEVLKVAPEGLTRLAAQAMHDMAFMLRPEHNEQVAKILDDPQASDNDKTVALIMLLNAEVSAKGELPFCQDTGTATIIGKKGQRVWTGGGDEEALSKGVFETYQRDNLRYSQTLALDMYAEKNSGNNLPAQIDLYAVDGDEYHFLMMAKGGGCANKSLLFQETKALLTPQTLEPFLIEKMKSIGTAACPPYHIAFVVGGTSAEACLKTVKLASAKNLDNLPTSGDESGRAFRDVAMEERLLLAAHSLGLGAQFGGKYFAHDVRVVRLPRHGASCPVGMGLSCSADRNIKCKINREGTLVREIRPPPRTPHSQRMAPARRLQQRLQNRLESPHERGTDGALPTPRLHLPVAQRNPHRGARHCPRQAQRASRQRRGSAPIP
jgi:fumarate hydratase class I